MTDYTISFKLSNETVYACYRGRFWRWDGSIWKESHLMTKKFERAKAADKKLTPQAFLTNGAEFAPLDEYEIDCAMLDALENAKPCKNAPIEPVEEEPECAPAQNADAAVTTAENAVPTATAATPTTSESAADAKTSEAWTSGATDAASSSGQHSLVGTAPATQSLSDAAAACLEAEPAERPGFDYSGMSARTVDTLHVAERMIREARRDYVIAVAQAVSIAHEELCGGVVQNLHNSKHGNRGEAAFCAWCASVGVGRRTAYNLLQVDALMQGATPEEQAVLEQASPSLLYAAAKPSAPAELVQGVKEGSITTHKQYQELLKENQQLRTDRVEAMNQADRERARADRAEAERDKARADQLSTAKDCNRLGLKASQEKARADKAEARAKDAENQLSGSRQVAEAAKLRADKLQEENAALKKQPIAAVVDEEEVERRANQRAHDIAEDLAAEMTADLQARLEQASSGSEQDARDAYDSIILAGRSITSIVQSAKMQFRKLPDDQREAAINQFVHTLASAQGEVSRCL